MPYGSAWLQRKRLICSLKNQFNKHSEAARLLNRRPQFPSHPSLPPPNQFVQNPGKGSPPCNSRMCKEGFTNGHAVHQQPWKRVQGPTGSCRCPSLDWLLLVPLPEPQLRMWEDPRQGEPGDAPCYPPPPT